MTISLTEEQEALVRRLIARGRYKSEQEVLAAALTWFETYEEKLDALRRDIEDGIAASERGEATDYDDDALKQYLDGVKARGRAKLDARSKDGA